MSLRIDLDIADAYVSERAFALRDDVLRARDPGGFQQTNLWFLPGNKATTFQPRQLRADWKTATGKRALSDWILSSSRWEAVQKRGTGDWFLKSRGLASGLSAGKPDGVTPLSIVSKTALGENQGLFVEMFVYGVPSTSTIDLLKVGFAGGLVLHVHSNGTADVEDRRPGKTPLYLTAGQPLAAGGQGAGKTDLLGKALGIVILPYRRGRLLVTTTQGGFFEVGIGGHDDYTDTYKLRRGPGETAYHITTDAGQVTLTPAPSVPACLTANPLEFPLTGSLTSPAISLPYAVGAGPSSVAGEAEQQDGTALTLSVYAPDGSAFAPTPTARQSGLFYQVSGTAPAAGGGATAGYSRYAPYLYSLEMKWERVLGTRVYGTSTIPTTSAGRAGNATTAHLSLSRDRQQKSFEFTIDNPGDAYTSVKDLWNRAMECSFDSGGVDAGLTLPDGTVGVPVGSSLIVFAGYADPADFLDGTASKIRIPCTGRRKRLRSHLLNDSQKFDGMNDTDVVYQLLHDAGVADVDIVIDTTDPVPLPAADPGADPLWQPTNGQSCDEFIQHLADTLSGKVFDDIAGKFYYCHKEYFTAAALAAMPTVPTVAMTTPVTAGVAGTRAPNTAALVALEGTVRQTSEEPRANDFWVLGQDDDGNIVAAHYEDWDSIHTRTAANWVGERRTLVYASGSITTKEAAQTVLSALVPVFGQALRNVAFDLPDFQIGLLPLEGPLMLENYGPALITAIDADLTTDRCRRSSYSCELLT